MNRKGQRKKSDVLKWQQAIVGVTVGLDIDQLDEIAARRPSKRCTQCGALRLFASFRQNGPVCIVCTDNL